VPQDLHICDGDFPKWLQSLFQILRVVTVEIVVNSNHGAQHFALHPVSIALPDL